MSAWRHVKGFLAFPFMGIFLVPAILLAFRGGVDIGWGLDEPWNLVTIALGLATMGAGLYLVFAPTVLFARVGRGTVAHFDPPERLVVVGVYRRMRNPLVVGVIVTVVGEGLLFGALSLLVMAFLLVPINHLVFIYEEEPRLIKRFGDDYRTYMENVPRWLPRLRPWVGPTSEAEGKDPGLDGTENPLKEER